MKISFQSPPVFTRVFPRVSMYPDFNRVNEKIRAQNNPIQSDIKCHSSIGAHLSVSRCECM